MWKVENINKENRVFVPATSIKEAANYIVEACKNNPNDLFDEIATRIVFTKLDVKSIVKAYAEAKDYIDGIEICEVCIDPTTDMYFYSLSTEQELTVKEMRDKLNNVLIEEEKIDTEVFEKAVDEACAALRWRFTQKKIDNDRIKAIFENWSPAGEKIVIEISYNGTWSELVDRLSEYYRNFDTDEHVKSLIQASHYGLKSVPNVKILVADADEIEDMIFDLCDAISKLNK